MKKKQSKKRWAWTEAQRRKEWSENEFCRKSPPHWFTKILDNSDKRRLQKYLKEVKWGNDPDDVFYNPKYNNSSAKWLWF